jgi:hypothetical protein
MILLAMMSPFITAVSLKITWSAPRRYPRMIHLRSAEMTLVKNRI